MGRMAVAAGGVARGGDGWSGERKPPTVAFAVAGSTDAADVLAESHVAHPSAVSASVRPAGGLDDQMTTPIRKGAKSGRSEPT